MMEMGWTPKISIQDGIVKTLRYIQQNEWICLKGPKMMVCVFGLWHLGSVTAACPASVGHQIVGLDFENDVVENLKMEQHQYLNRGWMRY